MKTLLFTLICLLFITSCHTSAFESDKQTDDFSNYYNQYQDNADVANDLLEKQFNDSISIQPQVLFINNKN